MGGLLDRLAHAPDGVLAVATGLTLVALYIAFTNLVRVRRIADVPTARVRSAPQGYVELVGTAHSMPGEPIIAPLSNTICCWYSYRIEERSGNRWARVEAGTSDGIFLLRDDTAECVIDPDGADVTSRHTTSWTDNGSGWGGHGVHAKLPSLGAKTDAVVKVGGAFLDLLSRGVGGRRYTERVILDGDPLYAIGEFRTLAMGERDGSMRDRTIAILRDWKRNPDTLRERFDANRDGVVDGAEWDHALTVAEREAARDMAASAHVPSLHTLRRPKGRRHFLLSNLEEFGLSRRYRWRMWWAFIAAAVGAASVALMLSTRV